MGQLWKPAFLAVAAFAALAAPAALAAAPTYNKDIAPILNSQCAGCHRAGEVAPFSLLTYEDAARRAALIATVTQSRYMPPWKPEPGFGQFQHERRLTDAQIALIAAWAKAGAPEGNPRDKPPMPVFAEGWQAGQPDQILKTAAYQVPADGPDRFMCFVLPLNLTEDSYIQTAEFRPGNRRVVHHGVIYVDETGQARRMAAGSADGSYPCFGGPRVAATGLLTGWAPGAIAEVGDPALSIPVKKGTDLVLQIHYHPSGKAEIDQSSVGLTYSKTPPEHGRTSVVLVNTNIDIPPGDPNYVVNSSLKLPRDVEISGIFPHAHWLCRDMKVDAILPDGSVQHLVWIKDWDFNWQGGYRFTTPLMLPKGTHVQMKYTYDNSAANPRNPSAPPARVEFGEQTTDEMAVAFLTVVLPTPADVAPFQKDMRLALIDEILASGDLSRLGRRIPGFSGQRVQQFIQMFDKNHDGKLDEEERAAAIEFLRGMMR